MSRKLAMGVVGAGVFGGYHAGKCAAHPRIDFIGIYDPDTEKCEIAAQKYGVKAYSEYQAFLNDIEAVVIAAPATFHYRMAIEALKAGCHALIEKPIAKTVSQGHEIVDYAAQQGLIVQVGHQERFVLKSIGLDQVKERPVRIEGHRRSTYSPRGTDVSVTLDLMTHDLDLVLWLMGDDPVSVSGVSTRIKSATPDIAEARLAFKNGLATLEASRAADTGSRKMVITYACGTVEIDFNAKTLTHNTPFDLNTEFGDDPMAQDSLGAATNAFVEAVLDGKPVQITGGNGLRALNVALKVDGVL